MGLANKLNALADNSQKRSDACPLGNLIDELSEEDSVALRTALASPASTRSIFDALRAENFKIDRQTITLHRKGFCRCKEMNDE
jgi:hypothetical protein